MKDVPALKPKRRVFLLDANETARSLLRLDLKGKTLDAGHLGGARLDVLEGEEQQFFAQKLKTLVQNHLLLHRENVVITPHIAFNSREALNRILETTVDNLKAFSVGAPQNGIA
jgi:D-lactate dehydrogenase